MKNTKNKTRKVNDPYEIYVNGDWEWRVLRHYKSPQGEKKDPYARVFVAVKSPLTFGDWSYGDEYLTKIKENGTLVFQDEAISLSV